MRAPTGTGARLIRALGRPPGEHAVGRRLDNKGTLTGGGEPSAPDLEALGPDGFPVLDTFLLA